MCLISKKITGEKNTNILDILRLIDNVIISLNKNTKILKILVANLCIIFERKKENTNILDILWLIDTVIICC